MNWMEVAFGNGEDLRWYQMGTRALVVFFIALIFIRFSGSRAFGMRSPFDNVLSILLGAVLARTITGSSPFLPTISAAFVLTILHRVFGWLSVKSDMIGKLVKGTATVIFENGKMDEENMRKCLVSKKDLFESMREQANIDSFESLQKATVERNGKISIVKKES